MKIELDFEAKTVTTTNMTDKDINRVCNALAIQNVIVMEEWKCKSVFTDPVMQFEAMQAVSASSASALIQGA